MNSLFLVALSIYLLVGFVTSLLIDWSIRVTQATTPYTPKEIFFVILLWPINVTIFIVVFIKEFFKLWIL